MITHTPFHYFYLGPLKIYFWGLMLAIAFLTGAVLAAKKAEKSGMDGEKIYHSIIYIIVGSIIGARVSFFIAYPYQLSDFFELFRIWDGGLTFLGGLIGGILGMLTFSKIYKLDFWKYADLLSPYLALGIAITRIGCFVDWHCYGVASNLPWAVCVEGSCVHPTQIYHLIADVCIFLILINKKTIKHKAKGQIFALFLMLYAVFRFLVDFWRAYDYRILLSLSQWAMILVFAFGLYIYLKKGKFKK